VAGTEISTDMPFDAWIHPPSVVPQVEYYWGNFAKNAKNTIETVLLSSAISDEDRPLYYLSTLASLHALQDFYTHSSWSKIYGRSNCQCLRADTWFNLLAAESLSSLYTGVYEEVPCASDPSDLTGRVLHGDYCSGENKDSYVRDNWREAYIHAYAATAEWVDVLEQWTTVAGGAALVSASKAYVYDAPSDDSDGDDLNQDLLASVEVMRPTTRPPSQAPATARSASLWW
jgi:hypothetical protein